MLLNKVKQLCSEKQITVAGLERTLKLGNGTIHRWDNAKPSVGNVKMVADYFNVSLDYLISDTKPPSQEAADFASTYDSLSEEQKNLVKCYISIINKDVNVIGGGGT